MTTEPTAEGSLQGLRVVDLSRVLAGPLCTQLLADHGADVLKVEPPTGDETRSWGPPFVSDDMSAYFSGLNRNKSNLCLDLRTAAAQEVLAELLSRADVLVENFKSGTMARWGFCTDRIKRDFPRLIHCRITGFGVDGPMGGMPGYDAVLQAYSGLMSMNGESDGPPMRVGVPIVDMVTGSYAFSGILLALHDRERTGLGQLVDCTLLDTAISLLHPHSSSHLSDGKVPQRTGSAHPTIAPYDVFDARDGLVFIGAGNDRQFAELLALLGLPADPRFGTNADRLRNLRELRPLLASRIRRFDRRPLAEGLLARGVPATALLDVAEALDDPHVRHRQMVVDCDGYRGIGIPIKLDRTPGSVRSAPRRKGEDTRRVLAEFGYDADQVETLIAAGVAHGEPAPLVGEHPTSSSQSLKVTTRDRAEG